MKPVSSVRTPSGYGMLSPEAVTPLQRGIARGLPMGSLRSMFSMKEDDTLDPVLSVSMQMDRR